MNGTIQSKHCPGPDAARDYKSDLRIDFRTQCAYREITEVYRTGTEVFGVDHFKPTVKFPELECDYRNLYYCCNNCNSHKGSAWPSPDREAAGEGFVDPCERDPFEYDLKEDPHGVLSVGTEAGTYTLRPLRANIK